jgi:DNA polymerase V
MQLKIGNVALSLLKKMYRPEVYYQKLGELVPKAGQQMDLYATPAATSPAG